MAAINGGSGSTGTTTTSAPSTSTTTSSSGGSLPSIRSVVGRAGLVRGRVFRALLARTPMRIILSACEAIQGGRDHLHIRGMALCALI